MQKNKIFFSIAIILGLLFLLVFLLKPDTHLSQSNQTKSIIADKNTPTTVENNQHNTQQAFQNNPFQNANQLMQNNRSREENIDDLRLFFESNPKDEQQILDHIYQSVALDPIEISINIIPFLKHKNPNIQAMALSALNNAMAPSEQEIKDPDFINHSKQELRKNISDEVNQAFINSDNIDFKQKIIAVYDRTNPSQADTEKMLSYIYQNNQNKTPNDMEIYYIKTSFNKYPNLYTQQFQKNEYHAINQKVNFKITQ